MALPEHILLTYGYLLLFTWVLVEQFGIPLPSAPVLLAAGALSVEHEISFPLALLAGLAGSLTADSSWFLIGRRYGHHVLRILCKLSLEPTTCVVAPRIRSPAVAPLRSSFPNSCLASPCWLRPLPGRTE